MAYIFTKVKEAISKEAKRFECISARYELPYCVLLLSVDVKEDISNLIVANIRCADHFVKIDEQIYGVIFFANRPDAYTKVANKLLYILEKSFPFAKISIGVSCTQNELNSDVITAAVQNLLAAQECNHSSIEDKF